MAGRDKRYIDPMFYIPDGMSTEVWAYRDKDDIFNTAFDLDGVNDDSDINIIDEGDEDDEVDDPDVVDSLVVISQTMRRQKNGAHVVDLVVKIDDIPGIDKYEFRITKAPTTP